MTAHQFLHRWGLCILAASWAIIATIAAWVQR